MFASITQEIRYALRQLRKSPGYTLTALLTLALGIGVTAAVYSVVQSVLLQPLPYPDPGSLVGVAWVFPQSKPNAEQAGSSADFVRENSHEFSTVAVMDDGMAAANLSVNGGHALQIEALRVSQSYFGTLGGIPALGRVFSPEEDRPGGGRTVVLSDGLWKRIFNRDPAVVGRTIRIDQESFTVVGVMPQSFAAMGETAPGVIGTPDLWMPLQLSSKDPGYDGDNYQMIARLRPGVSLEQARLQLSALEQPFYQKYPNYKTWQSDARSLHEFQVWKLQDVVVSVSRRSLLTLMGAVVAVLLVACLNLAGLVIARAIRRSHEIALRAALGATRGQLLRLLASEGLLLALGGAALALLVTRVATNVLLHSAPLSIPGLQGEPGAWTTSAIVLLAALASTTIFSLLPAWFLLRSRGREMRLGGPSLGENVSHARLSRTLMVAQVALAMVLVSTASLLLGTFVKLRALPSGVEPKHLAVVQVSLKGDRYASTRQTMQFVTAVMERLSHSPGVDRIAAVNGLPLDRGLNIGANPTDRSEIKKTVEFRAVTPGYFKTMGISMLAGRDLAEGDRADSDPVIVIGETTAKRWWPSHSPIGEYIRVGNEKNWRIVGVVADVQNHSLVETQGMLVFAPMAQLSNEFTGILNGWFPTTFAIRTSAHVNLTQVAQQAVAEADPEIPVAKLSTMQAVIDSTIEAPRFFSLVAAGFSVFALMLTVIGLFGLLSYQVTQRTREIGVRMALGSGRFGILRLFLLRGLALASIGIVLGCAASWLMRPVVTHLLSDMRIETAGQAASGAANVVTNGEQATLLAIGVILTAAVAASWLPARRAASVEPVQALRAE